MGVLVLVQLKEGVMGVFDALFRALNVAVSSMRVGEVEGGKSLVPSLLQEVLVVNDHGLLVGVMKQQFVVPIRGVKWSNPRVGRGKGKAAVVKCSSRRQK